MMKPLNCDGRAVHGDDPRVSYAAPTAVSVGRSATHVTERAALPRPGCARPVGCVARLPSQAVAVWPVWRLGAGRQPCVPTLRPAAAPEPCHRLSWYCEAPGCTRVDLHARCGLGSDVTAAPPRCPEARAGRRPADRAHSPSTTSPAPPHAPRGQQVHPTSTRRGGAVVVAVVGARQSRLSGWAAWSSTRVRGCEHAGCERRSVAADARSRGHICILHFSLRPWQRLSLHDAWVEYEPHPHGPSGERRFRLVETWCRGIFQRGLPTDPAPVALVGGPHRSRTAGTPPQFAFGGRLLLLRRVTALRLPKWAEMRRRRHPASAVWSGPHHRTRDLGLCELPTPGPVTGVAYVQASRTEIETTAS